MAVIVRKVELSSREDFKSYADWQALYMDKEKGCLIPNTELWLGKRKTLKINALGCKGGDIPPSIPTIGFFGDSTTFGVSFADDSWPQRVKIEGVQSLNCAVEGYDMQRCLDRYLQIRERVDLAAIVVYVGWHNIIYNHTGEDYWQSVLDRFDGKHVRAFCSIATCLIEECRLKGVESLLRSDVPRKDYANYFEYNARSLKKKYFNYWCNLDPTLEHIGLVLDNVARYNRFLKEYCRKTGSIFIDLGAFLRPHSYKEVPRDFFDVCHLRPGAYVKTAAFVAQELEKPLTKWLKDGSPHVHPVSVLSLPVADETCNEDLRKNVYPLW